MQEGLEGELLCTREALLIKRRGSQNGRALGHRWLSYSEIGARTGVGCGAKSRGAKVASPFGPSPQVPGRRGSLLPGANDEEHLTAPNRIHRGVWVRDRLIVVCQPF